MKKSSTIFDFIGQVFMIFGFTIVCLNIFCILFGESAQAYSTIFEFGSSGLSRATMLQFLLVAVMTVALRFIFFTDVLIKKASIGVRTVGMFLLIILTMILFICVFGWFPIDMWQPWAGFLASFGISTGVSTVVCVFKERLENKRMEEALQRLKDEVK